jgi:hypothetical protein
MSFGKWYEEKKNDDSDHNIGGGGVDSSNGNNNNNNNSSSWLFNMNSNIEESMQGILPTFHTDSLPNLQNLTFANMKASMEQQMPKQILGLNYQQRFKVR